VNAAELAPHPAVVAGDIELAPLAPPVLERLRRALSFPNPTYVRRTRLGFHPGAEPERIEAMIEAPDGTIHIPRGAGARAAEVLARYGSLRPAYTDRRSRGAAIPVSISPSFKLRDYQWEGINALGQKTQGLVVLPCGCGKTKLGVGAIGRLLCSTLVLVPTEDLADQWAADVRDVLGLSAGIMGGGKAQPAADVVIGIIDSVDPFLSLNPEWGARFGLVIVDEGHHAPAVTYSRVLAKLPARYRLGLTATPDREDGLTKWVEWSFGPTLLERTTREMIKLGYLQLATIEEVETGFRIDVSDLPEEKRVAAIDKGVHADTLRNALIAERVRADAKAGETCLVLCGTRAQAKEITDWIDTPEAEARSATSKLSKKKRAAAIEDLRAGDLPVLCATSLADEGLDIARLSRLYLATPQKARGKTMQRLGRLLRKWPGKDPRLVDFIDGAVSTLARRAEERRRVWRAAGLPMIAAKVERWFSGPLERSGLERYTHLIRGAEDPERSDIRALPEALRDRSSVWRRDMKKLPPAAFREPILALLADRIPRTFNRIGVELFDKTADILLELPPDVALWELVAEGRLEHTAEAPILFRMKETNP
jgi:superfamily II DNA or RNA helicase